MYESISLNRPSLTQLIFSPSSSSPPTSKTRVISKKTMTTKKKKTILVFSILTLSFAAAAALLDIFSQSSFWKKTKKTKKTKKIQLLKGKEEEKPNPGGGGGGGGGSTSATTTTTPGGPDRISELPVEILHRILGFLDMDKFLIGTSLVSTKWRNLWKSVPVLNFSHGHNVEKHHNFVDHVLRLRDSQASKIQIFRYYCYSELRDYDYLEDLHDFTVSAVVNQGAQEIHVQAYNLFESSDDNNNRIIHFNPSIFTSGRLLRKFSFYVLNCHYLIQFPRSMCCATQLTHLSLAGIRLPEGDDAAQLHLVCPVLETLVMCNYIGEHLKVLDISAPRLNSLFIDNTGMRHGHFDGLGGCRLEIRTPNLTTLDYSGRVYVDCFMENLPRITRASLLFSENPGMVEQTASFAIKLLKGLTSAESLTLGGFEDTLKDLLLTLFTSLRTLNLATNCNISSIHGMVHLLNNCNSLEKLYWNVSKLVKVEGDEHLMLPQCRLSHLKHVHIKNLRGHVNEIKFVKFLLKSSVVLEDLIIKTTKNSPKLTIEENLKQFIEEETSFRSIKLCVLQMES